MGIIILGLDGFSPIFLEKWLSDLPNFRAFMKNGVYRELQSTIPPTTLPAWVSMFTGKKPEKLQNFGLVDFKRDYSLVPVNPLKWQGEYIWDLLSIGNKRVGIFALPFLSKSYPVNGFMISDLAISNSMYPKEFVDLSDIILKLKSSSNEKEMRWKYFYEKPKLFTKLLQKSRYSYDFYFFLISISDIIMHLGTLEELKRAYIEIDQNILPLFQEISEKYNYGLIIVSDHGARPTKYKFNVNTYLHKKGYLHIKGNKAKRITSWISQRMISVLPISVVRKMEHLYKKTTSNKEIRIFPEIDYNNTKAFASGPGNTNYCGIWLNKEGIFEKGIVKKDEEQKLLKELLKDLKQLDIIEEIYTKEELRYPQNDPIFPDVVIKVKDEFATYFPLFPSVTHYSEEIIHSKNGIFIAYGENIKRDKMMDPVDIWDVAPTILHMLNLPIPNDIDGRVLMEIFEEDSEFARRKPKYVDPNYYKKKQENKKIKKAIKNLKLKNKF